MMASSNANSRGTIHLIAPVPAPERRTRLKKQCDILLGAGYAIEFTGWERQKGEARPSRESLIDSGRLTRKIILRGGGYGTVKTLFFYPLWSFAVFFRVLFLPRDAKVFCLGFETAGPAVLASLGTRRRIVFDDADRFSLSFPFPRLVSRLLDRLERVTSRSATLHLIPARERYGWRNDRMAILRNTPATEDFLAAQQIDLPAQLGLPTSEGAFVLYANGWIGEMRGAPILLRMLQRLEHSAVDVQVLLIGRGDGPSFEQLRERSEVYAFAEMPQQIALAGYGRADLLFSYYDPKIPINRLAASNKWGDAIYLATPFIVNSEVETARHFVEAGAAFAVPYDDAEALAELIEMLATDRARLTAAKKALRTFRKDYIPFDERVREIAALLERPDSRRKTL